MRFPASLLLCALLAGLPLLAAACSGSDEGSGAGAGAGAGPEGGAKKVADAPGWTTWDTSRPEALQDPRMENAERARAFLFNRLLAELTGALQEDGPVHALSVCKDRAPALAREVSEELGLRIGRTGVRLRNPANAAPAWAAPGVAEAAKRKRAWEHVDGTLGVLTPIQTASSCLVCHGGPEDLGEGVEEALAELYPEDAATGFEAGELRGWFWVESPPPPAEEAGGKSD